ncbi:MAG: hypothetical protein IKY01_05795 [Prevotella sp.]|nr:hypothetical protein [Prevotella sp.]
MKTVEYLNGSFCKADRVNPNDFGVIDNDIFMVENVGNLFKGKPIDLVIDALKQLNFSLPHGKEILFNVIVDSFEESRETGYFTKYVVFQGLLRSFM